MFDKTFNCLTFLFKLNEIDTHKSIDEIGKVMGTLPTSVVTIFRLFYESLDTQRTFIQERRRYVFKQYGWKL